MRSEVARAGGGEGEGVLRLVVRIGLQAPFRVVRQTGVVCERIPEVGAGRVGGGGDRDAGQVGQPEHVLGHHPTVGELVPLRDDVAVIVRLATPAESAPQRVAVDGTGQRPSGRLVEDGERDVDPLHDLGVADGQVHVGRSIGHEVIREADPDAEHVHAQ